MPGNPKGDRRERELVQDLAAAGWFVMRAPASGSSTDRELPDIIAAKAGLIIVIELKSSSGDPVYLDGKEIDNLAWVAGHLHAVALVGARFDREDFSFHLPEDLHRTDGGNYRVKKEKSIEGGIALEDLDHVVENPE